MISTVCAFFNEDINFDKHILIGYTVSVNNHVLHIYDNGRAGSRGGGSPSLLGDP